ncbi:MAG TPA: TAXI family TRAP transporter solute-binding subunit [Verrucomicrobiales bacterium]|nr:TAXI family TRAP transporter solute-binding subunit [Verrucomicrobiales bacterium]
MSRNRDRTAPMAAASQPRATPSSLKPARFAGVLSAFALALLLLLAPSARSDELRLLTMREGTAWYAFGATLYKLLKDELPEGVHLVVLPRGGGVVNPLAVAAGKADLAIANVATARWAYEDKAGSSSTQAESNLRALAGGLNQVWFMILARDDLIQRAGSTDLKTILHADRAPRIVMKPRGSSVPPLAGRIFEILDTSREDILRRGGSIHQVSASQIPALLRGGGADLYLEAGPLGHPTVTEACLTTPLRFLALPDVVLEALAKEGLASSPLPPFFKGQDQPVPSVDLGTVLIAHSGLSDEIAYLITKTLCQNQAAMARAHKAWSRFDPSRAGLPARTGLPLHPGAARYYREQGWPADDSSEDGPVRDGQPAGP